MNRLDLLKKLNFGVQVAEEEANELASYFVQTNQWAKMEAGEIDIVRGEEGAGKSAIYALLMQKTDEFFDRGILLVAAENPRGATVFKDLATDPPASEAEFVVLWKLYMLTIIAHRARDFGINDENIARVYVAPAPADATRNTCAYHYPYARFSTFQLRPVRRPSPGGYDGHGVEGVSHIKGSRNRRKYSWSYGANHRRSPCGRKQSAFCWQRAPSLPCFTMV